MAAVARCAVAQRLRSSDMMETARSRSRRRERSYGHLRDLARRSLRGWQGSPPHAPPAATRTIPATAETKPPRERQ